MIQFAKRMEGVSESATLKLNAQAQALKAQGKDIINLTAGEPDFAVPEACKQAVRDALDKNQSKYTPTAGIQELRELIAKRTNAQQPGMEWQGKNVIVSNGGKQAIFNALQVFVNPGDEVIIPGPYWLSYPEMARLAQGKPVTIDTSFKDGFKMTPQSLEKTLSACKNPKAFILNSPSNPTGAMYDRSELEALGQVLLKFPNVMVISDEIYDRVFFDGRSFCSFLAACPQLRSRTITVNGLSKSAAMTGWRVGWSVADLETTQVLGTLQGQATSGINSLAQWAAIAALKLPESTFAGWLEQYSKRRAMSLEILEKTGKIRVFPPEGAFYVFVGIEGCLKPGEDAFGFCERLLDAVGLAVIPGTPFGAPHWIRLSFAVDEATLKKGCERLVEFASR